MPKPFNVLELLGLFIKDLYEALADDLAFLFWICDALKCGEELLTSIHPDDVQPEVFVVPEDMLKFVLSQKAVVDEDTCQLLADSLM